MIRSAIQHVDAFIAPSRFSKEIHSRMGVNARIVYLPNFFPVEKTEAALPRRQYRSEPDRKPYFLFVGRLEKVKGVQTLIPVFYRYEKAQLWIAGDGNYATCLRRLAKGSDNVRFLGYRARDELQELYQNATALLVPSLSFEVFALVILEAFRYGTPVIVRNIGGMPELLRESGGGFTYDTDQQLLAAIDELLSNAAYRNRLGANGYRALKQKWTADIHLRSYFALIDEIATARGDVPWTTEPTLAL